MAGDGDRTFTSGFVFSPRHLGLEVGFFTSRQAARHPAVAPQCAVMEARINGRQAPVAVALWASVSEEVDKRLSGNLTTALKLRPDEWRSGEILWLIDAVGDAKAVPLLLKQMQETAFKGRDVRVRTLAGTPGPQLER